MPKLGFGKHADDDIADVPERYLQWLIQSSQDKINMCQHELVRRSPKVDNSLMSKIVNSGYHDIVNRVGQTPDLDAAYKALMDAITDAATGASSP